jgi:hypothetical protein
MSIITDIQFNKPKRVKKLYVSYAHNNKNYIEFIIRNVDIKRKLYKKNNKLMIDISFDKNTKTHKLFNNLENNTIENVCQKYNNDDYDVIKDNFISSLRQDDNGVETTLELNKYCVFIKDILFDKEYQDTYKLIEEGDSVDMKIVFVGIIYGKTNYKNMFMIKEITKTIDPEVELNGCLLDIDNSELDTPATNYSEDECFEDRKTYIDKKYNCNLIELSD